MADYDRLGAAPKAPKFRELKLRVGPAEAEVEATATLPNEHWIGVGPLDLYFTKALKGKSRLKLADISLMCQQDTDFKDNWTTLRSHKKSENEAVRALNNIRPACRIPTTLRERLRASYPWKSFKMTDIEVECAHNVEFERAWNDLVSITDDDKKKALSRLCSTIRSK